MKLMHYSFRKDLAKVAASYSNFVIIAFAFALNKQDKDSFE